MKITIETNSVRIDTGPCPLYRAALKLHIDDRECNRVHEVFYTSAAEAEYEAMESLGNILVSLWGEVRYFGFNSMNSMLDLDHIAEELADAER